jgi:hypothetical protein
VAESGVIREFLEDIKVRVVHGYDYTKRLLFDLSSTAPGKTTTLRTTNVEDIVISLPSKTGTLDRVEADRRVLSGFTLDFSTAEIEVMSLPSSGTLIITNHVQGKTALIEVLPNSFTLNFPSYVRVMSGKFQPATVNYVYLHCINQAVPVYLVTIGQQTS